MNQLAAAFLVSWFPYSMFPLELAALCPDAATP